MTFSAATRRGPDFDCLRGAVPALVTCVSERDLSRSKPKKIGHVYEAAVGASLCQNPSTRVNRRSESA